MALEKTLLAITPIAFTANGTSFGYVTVADTTGFLDKQLVYIKSNTQPEIQLQIKRVVSSTQFVVGPVGGPLIIQNYQDISAYLVSDNAIVGAPEQPKNSLPPEPDHYLSIYQSSPVNADRVIQVDAHGNMYGPSNPLPISFDGTVQIGDVSILDSTTKTPMTVNSDGSINVSDATTHTDLTTLQSDVNNFASTNHTDITKVDTDLNTFATTNHSDLTTVNTTITNFETANHSDLTQIDSDIKQVQGPVTPGAVASKSNLTGGQFNSSLPSLANTQQGALQIDPRGRLLTRTYNLPGTLDTFGTQTVAPRQLQINIQFFNGVLSSLVNLSTSGSGSANTVNGAAQFSTGTSTTAQCTAYSNTTTAYFSGCEMFAHFSASFTTPTSANSYQKIGLYNSQNGFYIGFVGTTFYIAVRTGGIDTLVPQSDWDMDTLTGTVGSLFTRAGVPESVDFTKENVWRIRFGWLGAAPIVFEVLSPDGEWVIFHKIRQPNSSSTLSIQDPNLPVTLDVSKSSADSTSLTVACGCWGAGITFATNILQDPQTSDYINVDHRNEIRTASSVMLIGGVQIGSILDTNMWSTSSVGSGSSTLSNGINILSTGTTANSSCSLNSLFRSRFIPGTINAFYAGIRVGDTGVANNVRRWGAYDTSDGVYFQLNGTTPGIGIRSGSSDTIITDLNGPYSFVLDTNFHNYEIQYSSGSAYYYQDNKLIHTYISPISALSTTPHYKLGFENTNSNGGTTNTNLNIRGSSILRYGEANARPRYFHPIYTSRVQSAANGTSAASTTLTTAINATKSGDLLVAIATADSGTLTITDNMSQTYSTAIVQSNGSSTSTYIFYVQNTSAGVTSLTITSTASTALTLIVAEYSNIATSSALDKTSGDYNTGSTSWTSDSTSATTQTNELLIGTASDIQHNNTTFVAGTGWTSVTSTHNSGSGGNITTLLEEQFVNSIGTYAATGTSSQSANILSAIATFNLVNNSLSSGFVIPNTATTITIGAGTLRKIIINSLGSNSATATFYDNITNSGNIIAVISLTNQIGVLEYDLDFSNGLTMVVNTNTGDFTVVYD